MKIGIVGIGIVGSGVLEVLDGNKDFTVKSICSRSKKEYGLAEYTEDFRKIAEDPEIEIVVETIGGVGVAKELVELSLKNRKHVVTANKYLIAHHGRELFQLAEKMGVSIFYEAGVAGGVPILSPLKETLSHARVTSVAGILNGTCNYILTKMRDEKLDFAEAVKKAQEAGYAEADPTFDIEGIDTSHKIALLTLLAYDRFIDAEGFPVKGIRDISYEDIEVAEKMGYSIKLIGEGKKVDGETFSLGVEPMLIPHRNLLSKIDGAMNGIEVITEFGGDYLFQGAGAGGLATAVSVVGDLYKIKNATKWSYGYKNGNLLGIESSKYLVKSKNSIPEIKTEDSYSFNGYFYTVIDEEILSKNKNVLEKKIKIKN
ncbi:MAG: homoserine dehydrogenase [Fusobacteriaceae bacterium]